MNDRRPTQMGAINPSPERDSVKIIPQIFPNDKFAQNSAERNSQIVRSEHKQVISDSDMGENMTSEGANVMSESESEHGNRNSNI